MQITTCAAGHFPSKVGYVRLTGLRFVALIFFSTNNDNARQQFEFSLEDELDERARKGDDLSTSRPP